VQTYAAGTSYSFSVTNSSNQDGFSGNGSVLNAKDSFNGTWAYTYDDFNRVSASSCTLKCPDGQSTQAFTYQYDRYGNRWNQTVTAGSGPQPQLTFNGPGSVPNNRIDGESYDAAGNLLSDSIHSYTYDAENRVIEVDGGSTGTYTYDADGRRVTRKTASGSWEYLYDLGGRAVTELVAGTTTTNRSEGYAGGRHLVTQNFGTTYFIHADWVGTERARTSLTGGAPIESCQNLPFGDGEVCTNTDVSPLHFTGKERDTESNLDDFDARYYSSQWARFMTPDWDAKPAAVPYAKFGDPQTLNLYSYVENAPLNRVDANGHGSTPTVNFQPESGYDCTAAEGNCIKRSPLGTPGYDEAEAEAAYENTVDQTVTYAAAQSAIQNAPAQDQSSGCGWCQKLTNKIRGAGWKTDEQIAQEAINQGEPPNGEYSFVFGKSCPDCKYYPKEVVEAVDAHEDQHAKDEHTVAGFEKLFSKAGRRELEVNAFKAELGVEDRNIKALESKGSARTSTDEKSLTILRNMRDQANGVIQFPQVYIP
jgi:RHS repeat-associated protein